MLESRPRGHARRTRKAAEVGPDLEGVLRGASGVLSVPKFRQLEARASKQEPDLEGVLPARRPRPWPWRSTSARPR